jgi:dTDP-4-amino-4,6-dideoxygalactose transaminase
MTMTSVAQKRIPFFRPALSEAEIDAVVAVLRSGWLTTGPQVAKFEEAFAEAVGARRAIALNSCTAALHVAVEALGLRPGQGVLVPTMTFAATAEIVRYLGGVPVLADCDPMTGNIDLDDAARRLETLRSSGTFGGVNAPVSSVAGIIPVHVGGLMMDIDAVRQLATEHRCWLVEDAAHAFPASWRPDAQHPWQRCGEKTADVSCFSFYANKTITTGEGGMATTDDDGVADRMRLMSLHGLSQDAWGRYSGAGSWDYRIVAPGYKYNLTDIAAAIGVGQLARAEDMRLQRLRLATHYQAALSSIGAIELPPVPSDRIHAWHLFVLRLRLEQLTISRNEFMELLRARGITCSVHWRPLHLHPYYSETYGLRPEDFPAATALFDRTLTLPLYPSMTADEIDYVCDAVRAIVAEHRR